MSLFFAFIIILYSCLYGEHFLTLGCIYLYTMFSSRFVCLFLSLCFSVSCSTCPFLCNIFFIYLLGIYLTFCSIWHCLKRGQKILLPFFAQLFLLLIFLGRPSPGFGNIFIFYSHIPPLTGFFDLFSFGFLAVLGKLQRAMGLHREGKREGGRESEKYVRLLLRGFEVTLYHVLS